MDSKGFFLGVIAAIVLFLLWKKETAQGIPNFFGIPLPGQQPITGGCGGPGGCGAPSAQATLAPVAASYGMISPGTPPLGSVPAGGGAGSFYSPSGVTPDSTFTFPDIPAPVVSYISQSPAAAATLAASPSNPSAALFQRIFGGSPVSAPATPGTPTTPSNIVPIRASAIVPSYADSGQGYQQQRYNVAGVPRAYISTPQVSRWVM